MFTLQDTCPLNRVERIQAQGEELCFRKTHINLFSVSKTFMELKCSSWL